MTELHELHCLCGAYIELLFDVFTLEDFIAGRDEVVRLGFESKGWALVPDCPGLGICPKCRASSQSGPILQMAGAQILWSAQNRSKL